MQLLFLKHLPVILHLLMQETTESLTFTSLYTSGRKEFMIINSDGAVNM